jgi:hypothetical protein
MAWIEARIGDHLSTAPQNPWLWHFRQEQGGQGIADADDAEQPVASAAQVAVLVDRRGNGRIDHRELAAESVNRRLCHLDCRAVAKTAAEAVFPFRPVGNQPGAHGLQFAQSPQRRGGGVHGSGRNSVVRLLAVSDHNLLKYIHNGMEDQPCSANSMWAHAA